jgi:hypothetical protein
MSDDLLWSLFPESIEADLPFFAPSLQAAPESFERDFEELVDSLDEDVQFLTLLDRDGPFPTYRVSTPSLASPSESTYTTDYSEDFITSEYSFTTHSTSDYSLPLDIGSEYTGVDDSVFSDSSWVFDSFGPAQLSPAFSPHVEVVEALSDDGPYQPSVGISPYSLSAPPPAVPTGPPVGGASMQQARKLPNSDTGSTRIRTGPTRTKFVCPYCGHRKYLFHSFIFLHTQMFLSSVCTEAQHEDPLGDAQPEQEEAIRVSSK